MDRDIRSGTKSNYKSKLGVFRRYCEDIGCEAETAPIEVVANFLAILADTLRFSYQSVCGYRSAISKIHVGQGDLPLGKTRPIKRLTRATFIANPPIPRYSQIWDVDQLLSFLETLHPLDRLTDMELSMKTLALVATLSISRLLSTWDQFQNNCIAS